MVIYKNLQMKLGYQLYLEKQRQKKTLLIYSFKNFHFYK